MADEERPKSSASRHSPSQPAAEETQLVDSMELPDENVSPKPSSRPSSTKPASRPTSGRPASQQGSRKGSARSGRESTAGDKPSSQRGSPSEEKIEVDRPLSVTGSRPASVAKRPPSGGSGQGSRPPSAGKERPGSGRPSSARPKSGQSETRPKSGQSEARPKSGQSEARTKSGQSEKAAPEPESERAPSGGSQPARADSRGSRNSQASRASKGSKKDQEPARDEGPPPNEQEGDPQRPPEEHGMELDEYQQNYPERMPSGHMGGGGGGGGGGDSNGSDDDDVEGEDEDEAETDEGSENDADMVVLDPDHPLMKRFQLALKDHLNKQNEKATLELREQEESLKMKKHQREDLGVDLYGVQQELARYQMLLEKCHDEYARLEQDRQKTEQKLEDVRNMYKDSQMFVNKEKKKGSELQSEVENLALRLFYMQNAKEDVRSDISIMRRAAEKAETEVTKSEMEKQKQDLFIDRLVEKVDKLKEEIAMYEAQYAAQLEETKFAKEALMEAYMEIESISLEKKQLFQQWSSSLIGMRRRDEAHAAMQEALSQQQQTVLSLETEIEGYKKSIQKEQEQNEKLTLILNKTERDIDMVKKQLTQCQAKHDALKAEYATLTRMLHETEQALNRASTDKTLRMNELNGLRKQIEREYLEKVKLEDEIMEKMRSQLTLDKASHYTKKLTSKKRDLTKQLETQMAEVENEISKDSLEVTNVGARLDHLQKVFDEIDGEIAERNEIIGRSQTEMVKRNAIIERKQNVIDQMNKKLENLINKAGGVELGPLEIQINSLQKSIDARQQEVTELQQMWLRQQSELVRLTKDKEDQSVDVQQLKKQLTILSQKKIRTENEIDSQKQETYDIERSIRNMQNEMIKMNIYLNKEKGTFINLKQDNILHETDFILALKEAEMDSILMQEKLDSVKEEKERLLNSLVEAERQIMLWEKKSQLARETRSAVDSEVGQGEIAAMKAEIHRMQVRYSQLMKQQEKMIQEMEKAVSRRDTIVTRGDAQQKMNKKVVTKGTFERQMTELKKKIKQTIQEANSCDKEIQELRQHQQDLSHQLEERQIHVQQLQGASDTLDGDIDRMSEVKQKNLADLVSRQRRVKYFQQAKDGKYTMLCRSETSLESEHTKQVDRMQALSAIVDRLNQEFPHIQPALRRVTLALSARTMPAEDETS